MLIVEIHKSKVPVIYRSEKVRHLVRRKDRARVYKFACVAQLLQRLKRYEYECEAEIRIALEIEPTPPFVYAVHVERLRRLVRKTLSQPPPQETESEEKKCLSPSTDFQESAT